MRKYPYNELLKKYKSLGLAGLSANHYELAELTDINDPVQWKNFLLTPETEEWIKSELKLLQTAELNKLLHNINDSNSVGKAQIITALTKLLDDKKTKKEGPAYIYTYIPLNPQQQHADNVVQLDHDPFLQ